jgi:hypothetical protein
MCVGIDIIKLLTDISILFDGIVDIVIYFDILKENNESFQIKEKRAEQNNKFFDIDKDLFLSL